MQHLGQSLLRRGALCKNDLCPSCGAEYTAIFMTAVCRHDMTSLQDLPEAPLDIGRA